MQDWLVDVLTEYYVLGCGRGPDYKGEGVPIAFKKKRFHLHSFRESWLSAMPKEAGSSWEGLDQSIFPRKYSCAELVPVDGSSPVAFFNIHTDHKGELARLVECAALMQDVAASPFSFVLTGDFNARPDSSAIALVRATESQLGTVDATAHIVGSFHGFRGDVRDKKIDYIFTNLPVDPARSYAVLDDDACGCYYSDHHALCAFVEV